MAGQGVDNNCKLLKSPALCTTDSFCSHFDLQDWYQDNITTLCTTACTTDMATWLSAVETDCSSDSMVFGSTVVDPRLVPYVFIENYDVACLQDTEDNWCFIESEAWQGSDYITWNAGEHTSTSESVAFLMTLTW